MRFHSLSGRGLLVFRPVSGLFLLGVIPDKHSTITLVAEHLVNGGGTPCSDLTIPRGQRSKDTFCVQSLGNDCLTIAVCVHLEDAPNDGGLLLDDLELHATDCKPAVLAAPGWIFDRDIAIPVALSSGLQPIESAAFLPTVDLLAEAHQKLLVHHAVQRQQRAGGLLPAVQPLCHGVDKDSVVLKAVVHFQHVGEIAREREVSSTISAIEGSRIALGRRQQRLERIPACESGSRPHLVAANELFDDGPALLLRVLAAAAKLVFDRSQPLQIRGVPSVDGAPHGRFHGVEFNSWISHNEIVSGGELNFDRLPGDILAKRCDAAAMTVGPNSRSRELSHGKDVHLDVDHSHQ